MGYGNIYIHTHYNYTFYSHLTIPIANLYIYISYQANIMGSGNIYIYDIAIVYYATGLWLWYIYINYYS